MDLTGNAGLPPALAASGEISPALQSPFSDEASMTASPEDRLTAALGPPPMAPQQIDLAGAGSFAPASSSPIVDVNSPQMARRNSQLIGWRVFLVGSASDNRRRLERAGGAPDARETTSSQSPAIAMGTATQRENFWMFFGGMPFYVSGGAIAAYIVVDKDGAVKSAGQLRCTRVILMRSESRPAWRSLVPLTREERATV